MNNLLCHNFYIPPECSYLLRALAFGRGLDHAEDVVLSQDQVFVAVELNLGPGVFPEQDPVAGFEVDRDPLAVVEQLAVAYRQNFSFLRLLFGRVRNVQTASHLLLLLQPAHDDAVVEWTNIYCHWKTPFTVWL